MKKISLILAPLLLLGACDSLPDWLGSADKPGLPGERFSVMEDNSKLVPHPSMESETVDIPDEVKTPSNGLSSGNFALGGDLSSVKSIDAGDEPDGDFFLSYPPLAVDNMVYVIDGKSNIYAYDANSLSEKWNKKTEAGKRDRDLPGGGLAQAYNVLYASTGYGDVIALLANDGSQVWKKSLGAPLRRPPVVQDDKVFAVTIDNQLFALSVVDGSTLWRHSGVKENTSFYGSANAATKGDVIVVAYSSGEVFGISIGKGNELWTELVALGADRKSAASALNDVSAAPVIVDGIVYIGGHSGDLDAFNSANGFKIWSQKLGPIDATPWVAGKFIFAIAQGNQLVAMNRFDGRIKWVSSLPVPEDKDVKNIWSGPVMAGGKLFVVGSSGKLLQIDPQNGQIGKTIEIPEGVFTAPVIADGKIFLLTRKSQLVQVK